jgi:hypothetical protein
VAYQLEVIRFRDLLVVQSIPQFVPGLYPPTLEIKGEDLSSASRVLINDSDVPEFMIVDKKTIYAQVPEDIGRISTIQIISTNFTRKAAASKLSFEIGDKTRKVDGLLKLVQLFTKWILQSPGSDALNPERGGGLQQLAGRVTTTRDMQPIYASITRSIDTTSSQIRTAQANQTDLQLSERLYAATLVDVAIYEAQMEARVQVRLQSMAGADAVTALQL